MLKPVYPSAFRKYESRMDGMSGCPNATCPGVPVKVESPREIQRSCVCRPKLNPKFAEPVESRKSLLGISYAVFCLKKKKEYGDRNVWQALTGARQRHASPNVSVGI